MTCVALTLYTRAKSQVIFIPVYYTIFLPEKLRCFRAVVIFFGKTGDNIRDMNENFKNKLYLILTGVATGVANGFFGGGGGMIVVPLMTFLLKMKTKVAHATALAVILPVTIVSATIYIAKGYFDWKIGLPSGAGIVGGGIIGAYLLGKLSSKWVTRIFALVMFAAGVKLAFF